MILADASVWINHFKGADSRLATVLRASKVLVHPWVIGELALGGLALDSEPGRLLTELPETVVADHGEVMHAVSSHSLARRGIDYVDAHLVVSVLLTPGARLWTFDTRLATVADELNVSVP